MKRTCSIGFAALFLAGLALLLCSERVSAGEIDDLFTQGNRFYDEGAFDKAAREYQKILDRGVRNAVVYFNLGNASYKQNKLGEAILDYERALRLNPKDEDCRKNLDYVRSQIVDIIPREESFLTYLIEKILHFFTLQELAPVLLVLYLLLSVAIFLLIVSRRPAWRGFYRSVSAVLAVFLLLGGVLFAGNYYLQFYVKEAVVLQEKVYVRSGPSDSYTSLFEVHEGLKVRVRSAHEGWLQISLANGLNGWAEKSALGEI
jgi:tetratricopeptide (TPR) repeat protein